MKEYRPVPPAERLDVLIPPHGSRRSSSTTAEFPARLTDPSATAAPRPASPEEASLSQMQTADEPVVSQVAPISFAPTWRERVFSAAGLERCAPPRELRLFRRRVNTVGFALAASPLLQLACSFLISYALVFLNRIFGFGRGFSLNDWQLIVTAVAYPVSFAIPILLLRLCAGTPFRQLLSMNRPGGLHLTSFSMMTFGTTLLGSLLSALLARVTSLFGAVSTSSLAQPSSYTPAGLLFYFFLFAVLPAFLEEFLFRGAILNLLRPYGDGFAILASAAFFALLHCNFEQAPPAFLTGLLFGYAAVASGSIWTSVLAHFLNNAVALGLNLLYAVLPAYTANAVSLTANAVYLLLGVVGCVLLFRKDRPELRLHPGRERFFGGRLLGTLVSRPGTLLFFAVCLLMTLQSFHAG